MLGHSSYSAAAELLSRPLLSLTMIVKNEASSIERVLRNALPFMDQWMILDTGSTDGTQVSLAMQGGHNIQY